MFYVDSSGSCSFNEEQYRRDAEEQCRRDADDAAVAAQLAAGKAAAAVATQRGHAAQAERMRQEAFERTMEAARIRQNEADSVAILAKHKETVARGAVNDRVWQESLENSRQAATERSLNRERPSAEWAVVGDQDNTIVQLQSEVEDMWQTIRGITACPSTPPPPVSPDDQRSVARSASPMAQPQRSTMGTSGSGGCEIAFSSYHGATLPTRHHHSHHLTH